MRLNRLIVTAFLAAVSTLLSGAAIAEPPQDDVVPVRAPQPGNAGWLGVQLAPVPAAVAAQLRIEGGAAVMVRNVFRDSPADRAGLDRYDVFVAVDGKALERGVEVFSQLVQRRRPGDTLSLTLFRGGQKLDVSVSLAAAPERIDERALKYEDDPDIAQRRIMGLRGKILRPGPDGWILDDLGELPDFDFEGFFHRGRDDQRDAVKPDGDSGTTGDEEIEESRRVDPQGETLHVRRNGDGSVEVSRYRSGTPQDQVEPKWYENMEQLRQADPEAADLLSATATRPAGPDQPLRELRRETRRRGEDLRRHQDSMQQYQDALREYMRRYQDRLTPRPQSPQEMPQWREWRERLVPAPPQAPAAPLLPGAPAEPRGLPEARFELHPDGSISAHVEDGPTELNLTFPNEQAFKEQAPRLYQRYRGSLERVR